jgi:hypothetical protein
MLKLERTRFSFFATFPDFCVASAAGAGDADVLAAARGFLAAVAATGGLFFAIVMICSR